MRINNAPRGTRKFVLFLLLAFVFLTKAGFVLASGDEVAAGVKSLFQWGLGIGVLLSACVVAFGGVLFLVDYGRGSIEKSGMDWIKAGLLGLLLTLGSWVILNTINPNIFNFNLHLLNVGRLQSGQGTQTDPTTGAPIINYTEIPIGMLIENLLSKKIDCYDFDAQGNPIAGDEITADDGSKFLGPTYRNHDRIDCYLKLADAAEKKSLAVENLSKEISNLMKQCKCEDFGNCQDKCSQIDPATGKDQGCYLNGFQCSGTCKNPFASGCDLDSNIKGQPSEKTSLSCCPPDIKEKIKGYIGNKDDDPARKHKDVDTIDIVYKKECPTGGGCNDGIPKKYYGLDEFYTNKSSIFNTIEQDIQVDKKNVTYIDLDHCKGCVSTCQNNTPNIPVVDPAFKVQPNRNDPSFTNPEPQQGQCNVAALPGMVKKKQRIIIGSNVDKAAVDWAIQQWNDAAGHEVFAPAEVNDGEVGSYCFYDDFTKNTCNGPGSRPPDGVSRIYDRKIDAQGTIPWNPAGYNHLEIDNGEMKRFDVQIDSTNSDIKSANDYRMLILHELGHGLGLDDMYDPKTGKANPACNGKSVMNNQWSMTGLGDSDKAKAKAMYQNSILYFPKLFVTNISSFFQQKIAVAAAQPQDCNAIFQQCLKDRNTCMEKTAWAKLNLAEQLKYLKEKMEQLMNDIESDLTAVNKAGDDLSKCNMAKPYIDLRQTDETTDKKLALIKIKQGDVSIAKYCNGFNYTNSECSQKCSDVCPITKDTLNCYDQCATSNQCTRPNRDDYNSESSYQQDLVTYQQCSDQKNQCMNKCYEVTECISNVFPNYKDCLSSCNNDCQSSCSTRYLPCSEEFKVCQQMCDENSKCITDNLGSCAFDTATVAKCKDQPTPEDLKDCVDSSSLCQSGSNQNAGYAECLRNAVKVDVFSSSYIWKNPTKQVCRDANSSKVCLDNNGNYIPCTNLAGVTTACVNTHPETAKCPASSSCPDCKCNSVDKKLTFPIENQYQRTPPPTCQDRENQINGGAPINENDQDPTCTQLGETIKEFRLVGPQCSKPAYNDDPLTFYCRQDWWNEPETQREDATGNSIRCSDSKEIPVGTTFGDATTWANDFLSTSKIITDNVVQMINNLDKIGRAEDYCQCDSTYENGLPVCTSCCIYLTPKAPLFKPDCQLLGCSGNSCQQMIDYLKSTINQHTEIKVSFLNFYAEMMADPRTDVFKELTFSRQGINTCSSSQNNTVNKVKLLNCQRILDDIVPLPANSNHKIVLNKKEIYHYCKGQATNTYFGIGSKIDNWFCCDAVNQGGIELKNPYDDFDGAGG